MPTAKQRAAVSPKATTDVDRIIGQNIRRLRAKAGLSQTALAEAAQITYQQVQKYEKGASRITVARVLQFAETLDVPFLELLDGVAEARGSKG